MRVGKRAKNITSVWFLTVFFLCGTGCSDDEEGMLLDIIEREPTLDESEVPNGVVHSFVLDTPITETFQMGIRTGQRHDAGAATDALMVFTSTDGVTFTSQNPTLWTGPGTHVHLIITDSDGNTLADPFFEYDVDEI